MLLFIHYKCNVEHGITACLCMNVSNVKHGITACLCMNVSNVKHGIHNRGHISLLNVALATGTVDLAI